MPSSCLPTIPLIIFGILEPAMLIWAYILTISDPFRFFSDQAPNHPITIKLAAFTPQAQGLTAQMGNVLALLAAIAVICCWTNHVEIVKWYLAVVVVADYGHVYGTYVAVGAEYFWDVREWNDMVWGNVGVSLFLNVVRLATLAGGFGKLKETGEGLSKKRI